MKKPHEKNLVYRLYIDEVGNDNLDSNIKDEYRDRYFFLCGVAIEEKYYNTELAPNIENLKDLFFDRDYDNPVILHKSEIMKKEGVFEVFNLDPMKNEWDKRVLELFSNSNFTVFSVLLDKKLHNSYSEPYNPYSYSFKLMVERFYKFLQKENAMGEIYIENSTKPIAKYLREEIYNLKKRGTEFIERAELDTNINFDKIRTKDKKENIIGLQIADLIAPTIKKIAFKNEDGTQFGKEILSILKSKIYSNNNQIYGCGIKYVPTYLQEHIDIKNEFKTQKG